MFDENDYAGRRGRIGSLAVRALGVIIAIFAVLILAGILIQVRAALDLALILLAVLGVWRVLGARRARTVRRHLRQKREDS